MFIHSTVNMNPSGALDCNVSVVDFLEHYAANDKEMFEQKAILTLYMPFATQLDASWQIWRTVECADVSNNIMKVYHTSSSIPVGYVKTPEALWWLNQGNNVVMYSGVMCAQPEYYRQLKQWKQHNEQIAATQETKDNVMKKPTEPPFPHGRHIRVIERVLCIGSASPCKPVCNVCHYFSPACICRIVHVKCNTAIEMPDNYTRTQFEEQRQNIMASMLTRSLICRHCYHGLMFTYDQNQRVRYLCTKNKSHDNDF